MFEYNVNHKTGLNKAFARACNPAPTNEKLIKSYIVIKCFYTRKYMLKLHQDLNRSLTQIIMIMKLLYFFLFLFATLVGGYLFVNDFSFDNITFSNYLINSLFILLLSCLAIAGIIYTINLRKKHADKGVMTIRQYYQYKS